MGLQSASLLAHFQDNKTMKLKLNMELPSEIELPDELLGANDEFSERLETLETEIESLQSQPPTPDWEKLKQDIRASVEKTVVDPDDVEQLKRDVRDLRNRANLFASEIDSLRREKERKQFNGVVSILDFCEDEAEIDSVLRGSTACDDLLHKALALISETYGQNQGGVVELPVGKLKFDDTIVIPSDVELRGQGKFQTSLTVEVSTSTMRCGVHVKGNGGFVNLNGFSLNVVAGRGEINGIIIKGDIAACYMSDMIVTSTSTLAKKVGVSFGQGYEATLDVNDFVLVGWKTGILTKALMSKTSCRISKCNTGVMVLAGRLVDTSDTGECNLDHYIGREVLSYETREGSNTFDAREETGDKATSSVGTFQTGDTLL